MVFFLLLHYSIQIASSERNEVRDTERREETKWTGWTCQRCSYLGNEPGLLRLASSSFPAQARVKNDGVNKQSCLFLYYAHSPLPADGGGALHLSARNWLASRPAALLHDSLAVTEERWRGCENDMGALAPKQLLRYSNGSEPQSPATRARVERERP